MILHRLMTMNATTDTGKLNTVHASIHTNISKDMEGRMKS